MKKSFFLGFILLLLFLFLPKKAFAQGTYDCIWQGTNCITTNNKCDLNFKPDDAFCKSRNTNIACNSFKNLKCISQSPTPKSSPTPTPASPLCNGDKGINTAIGCISALDSQEAFIGDILKWAVGVGGGIAFLLIVYASFIIMTSAGNPERLKAGQELLTSAISGLVLLIFSIFILKFIGIDILGLCKFGFGKCV